MVYDQAKTYRRAVDEALFGLGEQRYAALVDLLIQLRQPQLSKRPNEAALSRALTEALPPMDQAVVADVAEAFRSLDEEKDELAAASAAERAASAFLEHYRRYARIATRRRARLPRAEHSRYERVQRDLAEAQEGRRRAERGGRWPRRRSARWRRPPNACRPRRRLLREAPEMRDARELEHAALAVTRTAHAADQAREDRQQATALRTKALGRLGTAENRLRAARLRAQETFAQAREHATAAHLTLPLDDRLPEPELRRAAEDAADRAQRSLTHVEDLLEAAERAAATHRRASGRLDEAETDLILAAESQAEAEEDCAQAGQALVADVRERARAWTELAFPDETGLLDELQEWTRHLDGPYPARVHAARAHTRPLGRPRRPGGRNRPPGRGAGRAHRRGAAGARRTGSRRRTRAPTPATRTPGLRGQLPGAPLWRLVDFRDDLSEPERAGYEAALEASGLLDAWVLPDGSALTVKGHDVLLAPSNGPVSGSSLADVLRPAMDHGDGRTAALDEATVIRLLAAIGLDSEGGAGTWVAADGRYRVGALTGTWAKPAAAYIGEGARETARRARVAVLGVEPLLCVRNRKLSRPAPRRSWAAVARSTPNSRPYPTSRRSPGHTRS